MNDPVTEFRAVLESAGLIPGEIVDGAMTRCACWRPGLWSQSRAGLMEPPCGRPNGATLVSREEALGHCIRFA